MIFKFRALSTRLAPPDLEVVHQHRAVIGVEQPVAPPLEPCARDLHSSTFGLSVKHF